jgi:hypothetical protein
MQKRIAIKSTKKYRTAVKATRMIMLFSKLLKINGLFGITKNQKINIGNI